MLQLHKTKWRYPRAGLTVFHTTDLPCLHKKSRDMSRLFAAGCFLIGAQHHGSNHTRGNCDQQVITAILNPVITAWRCREVMATPVIHHIVLTAILGRHATAFVPVMVRSATTTTVVVTLHATIIMLFNAVIMSATLIVASILLTMAFAMTRRMVWLRLYGKTAQAETGSNRCAKNARAQMRHGLPF